jgi:hypothetical protein
LNTSSAIGSPRCGPDDIGVLRAIEDLAFVVGLCCPTGLGYRAQTMTTR